jgi:predicted O-methyltransferase YrrM
MQARTVLDIGTYVGTSAATFALAVKPRGGSVVTVDVCEANAPDGFWKIDERPHSPKELMQKLDVEDCVTFVTCRGIEYLKNTQRKFDFVCLDAGKGAEEDFQTIVLALEHMNPPGLMFLDDVFPFGEPMVPGGFSEIGPWQALERLKREAPVEVHQVNTTLEGFAVRCAFVTRRYS